MRPLGYRGKMLPKTSEVTEEEKGLDRFYTYLSGWIDKIEQELMPTTRKREMVCLKKKLSFPKWEKSVGYWYYISITGKLQFT